uniref:Uncharacterized protein n=1 Tax=Glossina palpalis gambiensis TaxID=67801 RepID=A0A1B0AYJ1_9MUSC
MTMKSMKYSDCDTIMDGYNPVPPPLPRRVPPVRNIYAEPFAHEPNHPSRSLGLMFVWISKRFHFKKIVKSLSGKRKKAKKSLQRHAILLQLTTSLSD